jgi:uncharacterized protein (DUF885 family)
MPPATEALCRSYLDLRWHFDPASATAAGTTEHDRRLGTFDVESIRHHMAAFRAMAAAVEDLEVESLQDEIDRTALLDDIRVLVFRLQHEQPHVRNPQFWLSHLCEALYTPLIRGESGPEHRARSILARLTELPSFLDAAQETLNEPPAVFVESATKMIPGARLLLRTAAESLGASVPDLSEELGTAASEADERLERFGLALETELQAHPDLLYFAVGEEQFDRRLHHEHALRNTAPELWRYGLRLQEEVTVEIERQAHAIDPSRPWQDLVERLREEHPGRDGLIGAYQSSLDRAFEFVREQDLATLPEGALELVQTPPFMVPLVPFAAYQPPGQLMAERTGYFYVTVPDDGGSSDVLDRMLREHCIHELTATAVHEGCPGHHLQLLTAQSLESSVRRFVWTPVMVEGWALYCEEMMGEEGFYQTPEELLFQQVHLLWRAIRVILDVGLHTRGMTPDEAITYMVDHLPIDRVSAEREVRRYCAWPTYQLCYAVGRREILQLRAAYREQAGSDFALKTFHDELLGYGGLPVSLIAWGMGLEG